jgi:phosphoglycolate phosphatase
MIKNLIFDFDGTIADDMNQYFHIFNELSKKYGYERVDKKDLEIFRDKGAKWLIKYFGIPKYKVPFLISEARNRFNSIIEKIGPFKGMEKLLNDLHQGGFILGILTTNKTSNVQKFLGKNNLNNLFEFVYSKSSLFGKHSAIINILKKHKLNKEQTCYVGDEDRDVNAAQKVGVKSIAVTWGFNSKKNLVSLDPDFIVDEPSEILEIVK